MGKSVKIPESSLHLPLHPSLASKDVTIIDTHCHLASTFSSYRSKYPDGPASTVQEFVKRYFAAGTMAGAKENKVEAVVDVHCEPPHANTYWRELAESYRTYPGDWNGTKYNFVIGVHPHEARKYNDQIEADILEAVKDDCCVGWGEIGLDYHYDNSPREIQQRVLIRQLKQAVRLNLPITIHTREADDDIYRILTEHVPKDHRLHIHCFTDTPELAQKLFDHFPNLYIGITGVITFATNENTSAVVRNLIKSRSPLRLLLETDSPFMTPINLPYSELALGAAANSAQVKKGKGIRLATSHSGMIAWTAEFVAEQAQAALDEIGEYGESWSTEKVLKVCRENARNVYGV